jgi:hypothetical protein
MSTWSVSRKGPVARIVTAIVAVAAISCAAKDRGIPAPETATAQRNGAIGQACLGQAPAQVLSLRDAKDTPFNLAYFRGCGWRYQTVRRTTDHPLSEPRAMPVSDAAPLSVALPRGQPLAVFIDGPTGYTFVWIGDGGWKFVGQMAGEAP